MKYHSNYNKYNKFKEKSNKNISNPINHILNRNICYKSYHRACKLNQNQLFANRWRAEHALRIIMY